MITKPRFMLTHSIETIVTRLGKGGRDPITKKWVDGLKEQLTINCNIQNLRYEDLLMLPESERTKEWIKMFSVDEIKQAVEGDSATEGDIITYDGKNYQVQQVRRYKMGVLDHYEARAVRFEISAGEKE